MINTWRKNEAQAYIQSLGLTWDGPHPSSAYKMSKVVELGGDSVLDIGCATGNYVEFYRKLGKHAVGIDLDSSRLVQAQTNFKSGFIFASAGNLPFSNKSFDTVTMWDVMEHTPDDIQTMKEAIRIARKNILISVPKETDSAMFTPTGGITYRHYVDLTHFRYYTPQSIDQLLKIVNVTNYQLEHWSLIRPVTAYRGIGVSPIITSGLDHLLYYISKHDKERFHRNLFVNIQL